jgi:hypothetical protein
MSLGSVTILQYYSNTNADDDTHKYNTNQKSTGGGESNNYATILAITHWHELWLPCGRMGQAFCGHILRLVYGGDPFGKPEVECL